MPEDQTDRAGVWFAHWAPPSFGARSDMIGRFEACDQSEKKTIAATRRNRFFRNVCNEEGHRRRLGILKQAEVTSDPNVQRHSNHQCPVAKILNIIVVHN